MRTASLVTLGALAVLIAGCGATIKPDSAAKSVVDVVKEQTGFVPTDVRCPDGVEAEENTKFECKFTGPEGKEYTADMRITKVDGDDVQFYVETRPS
jgi:hypothetical protein